MQESQKGPKACTTCAKAKARCIPRLAGDKCERCYRLSKDCFSRAPAPPRIKKRPKRSCVAELEKRPNELSSQFEGHGAASHHSVASLYPQQQQQQQTPTSTPTTVTLPIPIPAPAKPVLAKVADKGEIMNLEHLFHSPSSSGPDSHDAFAWTPDGRRAAPVEATWPLFDEDEGLLQQYHELFAHLFPFVVVPTHLTSAELRRERPFLWKAVMLASSLFGVRQGRMGEELLAETAKVAVVDGVKSLDLLQALQLLVAWFYFALKSSQVINLLFLARSMCVNLGSTSPFGLDEDEQSARTGPILTTNKRTDVFMNTTYVNACCKALELHREFPSDEYLVRLVKVQQLTQAISTTMAMEPAMQAMSLPLTMAVESFQDQLDTFQATLPPHLAGNAPLQCHISVAKVLMDVAISDDQCTASHVSITDRLQLLSVCVRSLRNFFHVRFAASELERPRFLVLITSDLAFAFITGIKLLTLQAPGWNVDRVGHDLALDRILARQIQDLSALIAKRKGPDTLAAAVAPPPPPPPPPPCCPTTPSPAPRTGSRDCCAPLRSSSPCN